MNTIEKQKTNREFNNVKNGEIVIKVIGLANSGKSTIQNLIREKLVEEGFKNIKVEYGLDFKNDDEYFNVMNGNRDERVQGVKEKINGIAIEEVQAVKPMNHG